MPDILVKETSTVRVQSVQQPTIASTPGTPATPAQTERVYSMSYEGSISGAGWSDSAPAMAGIPIVRIG